MQEKRGSKVNRNQNVGPERVAFEILQLKIEDIYSDTSSKIDQRKRCRQGDLRIKKTACHKKLANVS